MPVYVVGLILLIAVALFGDEAKGAQRWLDLGVTRIQPSELMKIGVPLMLAWYFDRYEAILKLKDYVIGTIVLVVPVGLIATQPDLGTAILVAAAGFFVLFLAGLSWKILVGAGRGRRRQPADRLGHDARLPAPARADADRSGPGPARRAAITPSSPPSRSAPAACSARAG